MCASTESSSSQNFHQIYIVPESRDINMDNLRDTGLIENLQQASELSSRENRYSVVDELVRGVLLAGMDNLLKHRNFEIRKGRLTQKGSSLVMEYVYFRIKNQNSRIRQDIEVILF